MFEMHDRWIEELAGQLTAKPALTTRRGHITLAAIAQEVVALAADGRKPDEKHVAAWRGVIADFEDCLSYAGSQLGARISTDALALLSSIHSIMPSPNGSIKEADRASIKAPSAALISLLKSDEVLVAAWRDLVDGCMNFNGIVISTDQLNSMRDNLFALLQLRKFDTGIHAMMRLASIVKGDVKSVQAAESKVAESARSGVSKRGVPGLTTDELLGLCERIITHPPFRSECVVWLRVEKAFIGVGTELTYGQVTMYDAQVLAGNYQHPEKLEKAFATIPTELLDSKLDRTATPDDYTGFEHKPGLVYVRVHFEEIECHLAEKGARDLVNSIITVNVPEPGSWNLLLGSLTHVIDGRSMRRIDWGPKYPRSATVFPQNDTMRERIGLIGQAKHTINPGSGQILAEVLKFQRTLASIPMSDPETTVMTAVRAIEQCNAWVTGGRMEWTNFVKEYLTKATSRLTLITEANYYTFQALFQHVPDSSPTAKPVPRLLEMRDDVENGGGQDGRTIDRAKSLKHVPELITLYADHPLVRPLSDLQLVLQDGRSIHTALVSEKKRVELQLNRVGRIRNAATHGGPVISDACHSVSAFAHNLATQCLNAVIQAVLQDEDLPVYFDGYKTDADKRLRDLKSGNLNRLYVSNPRVGVRKVDA